MGPISWMSTRTRTPRQRGRVSAAVGAALLCLAIVAPAAHAQDEAGEAFCELFTAKEVKAAFGAKVLITPDFGRCNWYSTGGKGEITSLAALWNEISADHLETIFGDLEEMSVGGLSSWFFSDDYSSGLLIEIEPGALLLIEASHEPRANVRDGLVQLGALAVERAASLPEPPEPAEPVTDSPVDDGATDATAAAFCAVLSADEVAAAVGGEVADGTPTIATEGGCEWTGGDLDDFIYASVGWDSQTLADKTEVEGESVEVGGRPGWFVASDLGPGILYVELDQGLLGLTVEPAEDTDAQAAVTALAELVVSRSASLVAPPAPIPAPAGAEDLEALFPKTMGGEPLDVNSATGSDALSTFGFAEAWGEAITSQGGDLSQVSVALGIGAEGAILAVDVGIDAATVLPALAEVLGGSTTATVVAGKAVTEMTREGSTPAYAYAKDDVIWLVQGKKEVAEEVLAALP